MELPMEKNGTKTELKGISYGKEWNRITLKKGIKWNDARNKMEHNSSNSIF